ncbi:MULTISPECIES: alpha/beta hydrolase fold domain-containing protein [unclassified Limnohabitans]|jgi:acetyl esterase|uniref:alpha/beta hydrolase fold domain-containing protein n=1 Tax=unclassified Limnohabitans TaxID=2626134 RepID=UPI00130490A2|nr:MULTISPECIES: alpha/beta hydrolase fold domain-containing protein [unclassified Limnohabitans]
MDNSNEFSVDPHLLAAFDKAAEIDRKIGDLGPGIDEIRQKAALARNYWNEGGPEIFEVSERLIPGPTRDVPVVLYRAYESVEPAPVFVFFHGGGFKIGNPRANDRQMREIAAAWGGVVISADYLHTPEHVFPEPVLEASALLQWIHTFGASWNLDQERIALGGVSAGACLSFGTTIHLGPQSWLRAAVGIVGAFSFDTATASMNTYGGGKLYPPKSAIEPMLAAYVPDLDSRNDPRAIPSLASCDMFPPTFIAAAELDVFLDASALMAARLAHVGNLNFFRIYPGMAHLFFGFSREVPCAAMCVSDVAMFLSERLPLRVQAPKVSL